MPKKKKRGGKRKYSLAAIGGATAALAPTIFQAIGGDPVGAFLGLGEKFTGFNAAAGTFNPAALMQGLVPVALGAAVAMFAAKMGLNRYLNLPWVKI